MAGVALAARMAALGEGLALEMKHTSQGVLLSSSLWPHSHTWAGITMASVLRTLATTYYEAYEGSGQQHATTLFDATWEALNGVTCYEAWKFPWVNVIWGWLSSL